MIQLALAGYRIPFWCERAAANSVPADSMADGTGIKSVSWCRRTVVPRDYVIETLSYRSFLGGSLRRLSGSPGVVVRDRSRPVRHDFRDVLGHGSPQPLRLSVGGCMEGFAMLVGHMCGDFLAQEDWQASNKSNPHPGPRPRWSEGAPDPLDRAAYTKWMLVRNVKAATEKWEGWEDRNRAHWRGHLACTVHCVLYTLAVWPFCCTWMTWWGALIVFATHWPIDRFRLARVWMERVSHQKMFANGPLSPWSVIVVDQIFHLLALLGVRLLHLWVCPT